MEEQFPELQSLTSLTRKVGSAPSGKFKKVRHAVPMLSLGNAFTEEDVTDFVDRIRRFLRLSDKEELVITAEPKIDGLSCSLRYEKGKLIVAATRGDGAEGEDVTANIRTIKDVPPELEGKDVPAVFEARGEVYMTQADFLALNERQKKEGKQLYVNPRNTAAGSLRQIDPKMTAVAAAQVLCLYVGRGEQVGCRYAIGIGRGHEALGFAGQFADEALQERRRVARALPQDRAGSCEARL